MVPDVDYGTILNGKIMIEFKWMVVILTIVVSTLFIYLTGKEENENINK